MQCDIDSIDDSKMLVFGTANYYLPETLWLEDGTIIEDDTRMYVQMNGDTFYLYYPLDFVEQMKDETESKGWKFNLNGGEVWNYVSWFCAPTVADINRNEFEISAKMLRKMLEYRSYDGL